MSCIEVAGRSDIFFCTLSSVLIAFSCCMEKDDAKSMVGAANGKQFLWTQEKGSVILSKKFSCGLYIQESPTGHTGASQPSDRLGGVREDFLQY